MRKILILSVSGVCVVAASAPALADSKSAAEFVLKTCLVAMHDPSKVEVIAREENWFTLPPTPVSNPDRFASKMNWRAGKLFVHTWTNKQEGNVSVCFVGLLADNTIKRDEFFNAISASVELRLISQTSPGRLRIETYQMNTGKLTKVQVSMAAKPDGSMSSIMFSNCSTSTGAGWCETTP